MTDREALLAAVCENPEDDTPRLVFADWLQENNEPERAEFIRLQVRLGELLRSAATGTDAIGRQVRKLWLQHGEKWRQELPRIEGIVWHDAFFRGFVEWARVSSDEVLVRHADIIFNRAPILHLVVNHFEAVDGFSDLRVLGRLRTMSLSNPRATDAIVRRLLNCDVLSESMLLMCHFGPNDDRFYHELHRKFGERLASPTRPVERTPGIAFRG